MAVAMAVAMAVPILAMSAPAEARSWRPKLENHLSLLPTYYFEDVGQGTTQWASVIRGESSLSFKPSQNFKVRLVPMFFSDPTSKSSSEVFIADLNEANGDLRFGDWGVRAGINSISWGVTDVFNPLDVVSARRYTDPLNADKRGVPSLDLSWEKDAWRVEGIYIPVQLNSILPGENSRWLPRDISYNRATDFGKVAIDSQFKYTYADQSVIDEAFRNNFGFRLERHGTGLDFTAIFFQGAPTAPAIFTPVITGRYDFSTFYASEITIQPIYYLRRTTGMGVVWTLESAIVRLAAANSDRISNGRSLPGWSQSGVLGIEKNFSLSNSTLTMLLQTTFAQHEDQADNSVTSLDRIFDKSLLLGLRLATSSEWSFNFAVLYDGAYRGWYGQAKAERKLTDGLTASVQGDLIDGEPGTPLGTYRRNRRLNLGLLAFF